MGKNIEIDLVNKYDLIERYNQKKISNNMIKYIIKEAIFIGEREEVKIIINKKCDIDQDCIKMIREGLKEEYDKSMQRHHNTDIKQFVFFILGAIFIFWSILIKERLVWKEILLITGWVPIWKMIELELFSDMEGRKKRRFIKKLLKSEIIEK